MATVMSSRRGPVLILTLNRPAVRNALSRELRAELSSSLTEAADDLAVRAVVITGSGRDFCAGLDLAELEAAATLSQDAALEDSRSLAALYLQMIELPKPIVAAVNGAAVAGGAGLVNASDMALAASSARFGYTEARIGFVAAIVAAMLVRQVSDKAARELLLGAGLIDADRALEFGLINQVVSDNEVLERAVEAATALARNAPGSLAVTKALLADLHGLELPDALELAARANAQRRSAPELAEGVRAFFEKRPPAWLETTSDDLA